MPRLLTGTFTTAAFDRSSFGQFGASPDRATPKVPPSSFAQHGAVRAFMAQRLRFTGTLRLTCVFSGPRQTGHFYFARKRTFLLCLDKYKQILDSAGRFCILLMRLL